MPSDPPLSTRTRLTRLFASWLLVGIGVPMIVRAELGVSPFDVLNSGLSDTTGWPFGTCFVISSIAFFAIGRILGASLGWASLTGTLVIGPIINVVLALLPEREELAVRVPMLLAGIGIIAVAITLVVTTELGPGPSEVVMLGLIHRGMPIVPARWIADGSPVAIGVVLGGALGVGTVLFAVVMGPMVKWGLHRLHYTPPRARPTTAWPEIP